MHVPRAGPAARNLRVPAINSITLEYKMRVINFITNYVGPAGAHFNLTSKSGSQSQLELESSRVESQLNVAVTVTVKPLPSQFFSLLLCCRLASEPLPMSLAHGSQSVSPSVCLSIGQSIITRFGCRRLTNQTRYRSAKIYGSNKIYSALSLAQTPTLPLARALDANKNCQALRVWPSKCCTPHHRTSVCVAVGETRWQQFNCSARKCRLHLNFEASRGRWFLGHVGLISSQPVSSWAAVVTPTNIYQPQPQPQLRCRFY